MTLSVCLIAHNEEENLGEALESVHFADDLVVADCDSRDETALIARSFGARVFSRSNVANLNVNKNYTFDQARGDYILCLDADEIIPADVAQEIRELLHRPPAETAFFLPRRNFYFGRWLRFGGHYPDWQLRLFRRGKARFPENHIHERLQVDGTIGRLRHPFDHFPYRDQAACQRKLERDTDFEASYLFKQGVRPSLWRAVQYQSWQPGQRFLRRYLLKGGFLDGVAGLRAILLDMRNFRMRYRKLCQLAAQGDPKW